MDRVKDLDLYQLLEVEQDATDKEIKKAYRKKALTCHPDKNPDNKDAVALFHQLSDALEVLADENTRRAYDNVLRARKAAELRTRQLDSKRRKLKTDLEEREKEARYQEEYNRTSEEEKLAKEIERLRKEGSKQLEEEQEYMRQQLAKESVHKPTELSKAAGMGKIKVKWTKSENSPYNSESLEKIFSKYGTVSGVVVGRKGGSALLEFQDAAAAKMAAKIETGFFNEPLKVKDLGAVEESSAGAGGGAGPGAGLGVASENDFESLVLRKLRQEEERKRLIAQMMAEEGES